MIYAIPIAIITLLIFIGFGMVIHSFDEEAENEVNKRCDKDE